MILEARRQKAAKLSPEKPYAIEERVNKLRELGFFDPTPHGLQLRFGGLPTGQGFALGPQYLNSRLAGEHLALRTSIAGSTSMAWLADFQLTTRDIADDRVFADLFLTHLHAPRLDYYGQGPDSEKDSRTTYRLETNLVQGQAGIRPIRPLSLGVSGAYLTANAGPGTRAGVARTEDIFDSALLPGLDNQPDFVVTGAFAQFDYRDVPGGPHKGGNYLARLTLYDDRGVNRYSFRRLDLEAQQFIPVFQARRVIALRVASAMTFANGAGQAVPFYLQPRLGGSDDLRGFRPYRFHDNNQLIFNAEYRWETFAGLDMALFYDAGKVVPTRSQINFHDLESAAGFGFRFNGNDSVFLRIDFGFSREGFQFWFKFSNPF